MELRINRVRINRARPVLVNHDYCNSTEIHDLCEAEHGYLLFTGVHANRPRPVFSSPFRPRLSLCSEHVFLLRFPYSGGGCRGTMRGVRGCTPLSPRAPLTSSRGCTPLSPAHPSPRPATWPLLPAHGLLSGNPPVRGEPPLIDGHRVYPYRS